MKLVSHF